MSLPWILRSPHNATHKEKTEFICSVMKSNDEFSKRKKLQNESYIF